MKMTAFSRVLATLAFAAAAWILSSTTAVQPVRAAAVAPTITLPADGTELPAGPDFATDVLHDPWDFDNVQDVAQLPTSFQGWTTNALAFGRSAFVQAGAFKGATSGTSSPFFPLHYQGFLEAVTPVQDRSAILTQFAIPTTTYGKLAVKVTARSHTTPARSAALSWYHNSIGAAVESSATVLFGSVAPDTTRIQIIDLASRKWIDPETGAAMTAQLNGAPWESSPLTRGLVVSPLATNQAGVDLEVDWIRLTTSDTQQPGLTPISFKDCTFGDPYIIRAFEGSPNGAPAVLEAGTIDTQVAVFTAQVNLGVLAPGNWNLQVQCAGQDSPPVGIVINQPPVVTVLDPDARGGKDFAEEELHNKWDWDSISDAATMTGVKEVNLVPDDGGEPAVQMKAALFFDPGPKWDPTISFLNFGTALLQSSKYKHLTFTLTLDRAYDLGLGSVLRLFWASPGMNGANMTVMQDMLVWPGRNTYTFDLSRLTVANGGLEPCVGCPQIPWKNRMINAFRLDPHEFPEDFTIRLGPVTLTADDSVLLGQTFDVKYSFADTVTAGTTYQAAVYVATDLNGAGQQLLDTIPGVAPNKVLTYTFDPVAKTVTAGDYYIRVEITETRGPIVQSRAAYSTGVIHVAGPDTSMPQTTVLTPPANSTQPLLPTISGCAYDAGAVGPGNIGVDDLAVYAEAGAGVTGPQAGKTLLLGYGSGLGTLAAGLVCSSITDPTSNFRLSGFTITGANLEVGSWTLRTVTRSSVNGELTTVATPFSVTDQPLAATNFAVTASGNRVTVTFSAPSGGPVPGRYLLQVGPNAALSPPAFEITVPSPGSYSGDLGNGIWHFRLRSLRSDGLPGGVTNTVSLVLPGGAPPPSPPGPPVMNAPSISGNTVTLGWSPGPGGAPTSYTVIAGSTPGSSSLGTFPMGTATGISATVGNGAYYVRVSAANASGSATSNEVNFTIGPTSPPGVPTLNPASVSGGNVTMTWTTPSGSPTGYTIRARLTPGGPIIAALPVTGNSITVAAPPGTYLVTILATNSLGASAESNQITIVVP